MFQSFSESPRALPSPVRPPRGSWRFSPQPPKSTLSSQSVFRNAQKEQLRL
ncbi:unnamed protein product, partial [Nesidiocoris tenuis]